MKKVMWWFGSWITLGEWKCIWNLRPGDIISSEYDSTDRIKTIGRQLTIEGFRRVVGKFILYARPDGCKRAAPLRNPVGLILLSRPGMKFQVGDKVWSAGIPEMTGEVIVICPEKRRRRPYLVAYDNATTGYKASDQYARPWFPSWLKGSPPASTNREWCSEEMLITV